MADRDSPFSTAGMEARLKTAALSADETVTGDVFSAREDRILQPGRKPRTGWKPAAVLILVIDHGEEDASVLFTLRAAGLNSHSGQVSFPGGRVESEDRTPADAALREAHEEIALDPVAVRLIGTMPLYYSGSGYAITPVVGTIPAGLALRANPDEVQSIFEVPLSFLMNPANYQLRSRMAGDREHHFYVMAWQGHVIWGMTTGILRILYERLYG